jgi:hypothetical protein
VIFGGKNVMASPRLQPTGGHATFIDEEQGFEATISRTSSGMASQRLSVRGGRGVATFATEPEEFEIGTTFEPATALDRWLRWSGGAAAMASSRRGYTGYLAKGNAGLGSPTGGADSDTLAVVIEKDSPRSGASGAGGAKAQVVASIGKVLAALFGGWLGPRRYRQSASRLCCFLLEVGVGCHTPLPSGERRRWGRAELEAAEEKVFCPPGRTLEIDAAYGIHIHS